MSVLLTIGEFSRMTHLSVKALRHYDDVGLLSPAQVDRSSGYRRYATGQVPAAQIIRRFRDLGMPLEEIRAVLTPDLDPPSPSDLLLSHDAGTQHQFGESRSQSIGRTQCRPSLSLG